MHLNKVCAGFRIVGTMVHGVSWNAEAVTAETIYIIDMKRKFLFMAAAATVFAAASCSKTEESGDEGNKGGESTSDEISYTVASADAFFCGVGTDESGNALNYDMYLLSLASSGVSMTSDGYSGIGAAVLIDMNTPTAGGSSMSISNGHYSKVSDSEVLDYVFYPGQLNSDDEINPTYVYYRPDERKAGRYYVVKGGSLTIGNSSNYRTISAYMDTQIGTFVFNYSSGLDITYTDITEDDDPSTGGEISLDNLSTGYAQWYGQAFDESYGTDYSDWILYIGEKGVNFDDASASFLQLELLTEASATTVIPDGTYSFVDFTTAEKLTSGSMLGGYLDEDYYCWGTWFFGETEYDYYGATSGSATIKYADGVYDIDFEMEDTSSSPSFSAAGHFKATLQYVDGTKEEETAQLSSLAKGRLHRAMLPTVRRQRISRSNALEAKALLKSYSRK